MTNVERRIGAPDTRPLPRTERRHGAVDTRDSEKPSRSTYRVNYYLNAQPASAFVVAFTELEAVAFLGVRDGAASVSNVAHPVEVVGTDPEHAAITPILPSTAPPLPPRQLTDAELAKLRTMLGKVSPGDQPSAVAGTNPAKE